MVSVGSVLPLLLGFGCTVPHDSVTRPGLAQTESSFAARRGDEIAVAGRLFHTGARVVLWCDRGGYDAYRLEPAFPAELGEKAKILGERYGHRRSLEVDGKAPARVTLEDLQRVVDQFVIHFDVCGTARQCFKILHDHRKLSVHFLLDVDGTIYQTLDLRERAWHATKANDRAVGIEIAHIGAYPHDKHKMLVDWYRRDEQGVYVKLPAWMKETGLRPGFVGRPARPELIEGVVQGERLWQYDFTPEQYHALAKLTRTLSAVLPEIRLDAPRAADGTVRDAVLGDAEFEAYSGVLGHYHVQKNKTDPGPAFDWSRVLAPAPAR